MVVVAAAVVEAVAVVDVVEAELDAPAPFGIHSWRGGRCEGNLDPSLLSRLCCKLMLQCPFLTRRGRELRNKQFGNASSSFVVEVSVSEFFF